MKPDAPAAGGATHQSSPEPAPAAAPIPAATSDPTRNDAPALPAEEGPPRYFAWTDRWDPGNWETPSNPTPLQRVLAGVALIIVLVMTIYVPLKLLNLV